jgi:hypothetical protein
MCGNLNQRSLRRHQGGLFMIGHDTQMRDWLNIAISARASSAMKGVKHPPTRSKELKTRLDDHEQARQLKELIGKDPY